MNFQKIVIILREQIQKGEGYKNYYESCDDYKTNYISYVSLKCPVVRSVD